MIKEAVAVLQIRVLLDTEATPPVDIDLMPITAGLSCDPMIVYLFYSYPYMSAKLKCRPFHVSISTTAETELYCKPFSGYILDMDKLRTSAQILEGDADFHYNTPHSLFGTNSFYAGNHNDGHLLITEPQKSLFPLGPEPQLQYGQGTIEFWYKPLFLPPSNSVLFDIKEFSTEIRINERATGYISVTTRFGATTYESSTAQLNLGSWNHIAVTLRDAVYADLYLNGERVGTIGNGVDTIVTSGSTANHWRLGLSSNKGYFNDFRVSKNVRYTGSGYNIPTTKLVNDADTYILYDLETYEYEQSFFNQNETYTFTATDDFVRDTSNNRISSDAQVVYEFPSPDVLQIENAVIVDTVDAILTYNREDFDGAIKPGIGEVVVTNSSSHVKTYNRHQVEITNNTVKIYDLEIDRNYISATPTAILDINNYSSQEETNSFILDIPVADFYIELGEMYAHWTEFEISYPIFDTVTALIIADNTRLRQITDQFGTPIWQFLQNEALLNSRGYRLRIQSPKDWSETAIDLLGAARRYRLSGGHFTSNFTFNEVSEKYKGIVNEVFVASGGQLTVAVKETDIISNFTPVTSSMSALIGKIHAEDELIYDVTTSSTAVTGFLFKQEVVCNVDSELYCKSTNVMELTFEPWKSDGYYDHSILELGLYNFATGFIDWGDGTVDTINSDTMSHDYDTTYNNRYQVRIECDVDDVSSEKHFKVLKGVSRIISIDSWTTMPIHSFEDAFKNNTSDTQYFPDAIRLTTLPNKLPPYAYNLNRMFYKAFKPVETGGNTTTQPSGIRNWDMSRVTNARTMFGLCAVKFDLSNWNLSSIIDMEYMFYGTTASNFILTNWTLPIEVSFEGLFEASNVTNVDFTGTDLSKVTDMSSMFFRADNFNQDISGWDVSNVTRMYGMFDQAPSFNQPLNNWNVSNVTDMRDMFSDATNFNQPLNNWNVSNVTTIRNMFNGATSFNQPLNNWNVSNVIYMISVFREATSFNQPLNNWNVSNVKYFDYLFDGADNFNQDLSGWDVSSAVTYSYYDRNTDLWQASYKPNFI